MSTTTPTVYAGGLSRRQVVTWRNAIFVIFAVCGVGMASWASRLPTVRDDLGATPAQIGFLIFAISVGSIGGLLVSSHVIAWLGARRAIAVTFVVAPIGYALGGVGEALRSYPLIIVGLVIFGLGFSICDVAMNLQGAANERVLGRTIMPVFHAFFSLGTVAGAGVGALLEALRIPVVVHIGGVAVIMLAAVLLSVRALRSEHLVDGDDPEPEHATSFRDRLRVWLDPITLLIGLIALGMAFAEGSANDWVALASVDGHGLANSQGSLMLGLFVAAMTAGRIAGTFVLDRFGRVPVLRVAALLAVVGILAFVWIPSLPVAIVGVVLWGLGASLGFPVAISAAADDPAKAAGRVSAVATIAYCAFLVGPPLIGFLGDHVGVLHALTVVLVLVALSGLVSGAARKR